MLVVGSLNYVGAEMTMKLGRAALDSEFHDATPER